MDALAHPGKYTVNGRAYLMLEFPETATSPDYRDIAKWARTRPAMIASFYDQTCRRQSVERIVGFRHKRKAEAE